jgi:peptidoglycan hydrolase CwlO-like protein
MSADTTNKFKYGNFPVIATFIKDVAWGLKHQHRTNTLTAKNLNEHVEKLNTTVDLLTKYAKLPEQVEYARKKNRELEWQIVELEKEIANLERELRA